MLVDISDRTLSLRVGTHLKFREKQSRKLLSLLTAMKGKCKLKTRLNFPPKLTSSWKYSLRNTPKITLGAYQLFLLDRERSTRYSVASISHGMTLGVKCIGGSRRGE